MNKKSIFATLVAFSAIGVASAEAPLQVEGSVLCAIFYDGQPWRDAYAAKGG